VNSACRSSRWPVLLIAASVLFLIIAAVPVSCGQSPEAPGDRPAAEPATDDEGDAAGEGHSAGATTTAESDRDVPGDAAGGGNDGPGAEVGAGREVGAGGEVGSGAEVDAGGEDQSDGEVGSGGEVDAGSTGDGGNSADTRGDESDTSHTGGDESDASPAAPEDLGRNIDGLGIVTGGLSPVIIPGDELGLGGDLVVGLSAAQKEALAPAVIREWETPGGLTVLVVRDATVTVAQVGETESIGGVALEVLDPGVVVGSSPGG
jgi:hypothetical protein